MAITKEQAIEILDFFDFFQGQRAGRELWAEKPYEVQEEDLAYFSERVSLLKEYIADVVPKSEYDEVLSSWKKIHDSYDADCIEHYKYGRAEVAREIFEEIEKYKRIIIEGAKPVYTLKQRELEELKKKYTEGEK